MTSVIETSGMGRRGFLFRALTWIFYAARPLQMEELREARLVKDRDVSPGKNHGKDLTPENIIQRLSKFRSS
jgi:hypothetical protein